MTKQAEHPSVKELTAFALGQVSGSQAEDVERHIDLCDPCTQTLIGLSTDDTFVGLLKQAGNPATQATMGVTRLDDGLASHDAKEALAEHSRYEIVEPIAQGGMGKVFKATHRMMDRTVALKVIKNELMRNTEVIERFHREVKAAAQLSHPNIVTAYDAEHANGVHFLVMEYVEGKNLSDLVKRDGQLPIAKAIDYARQAAAGLQHAHERGMVHRDMKPHNLMLTTDRTVKILDFGLASLSSETIAASSDISLSTDASLTKVGRVMGSPDFISPEQATDARQADIRSDIYSLGATLYYLLCGQPPFSNGGVAQRLKDHVETTPVPVNQLRHDVPQELADVVSRMLAKDPAQRYTTPEEVESALVLVADDHSMRKQGANRWLLKTVMALVGVTIAALLASLVYIETDKGTLAIETMDENVKVTIRKVPDSGGDEYTKLEVVDTVTGSSVSRLRTGEYKVSLEDENSEYQLNQEGFTLSRGGKVVVTVTQQEKAEPPPLVEMPIPKSARQKLASIGYRLSEQEALEMQAKLEEDPEDLVSRLKLMSYYSHRSLLNRDAREPQLKLLRWFLKNYPEDAGDSSMGIHGSIQPEAYVEIKQKWLALLKQYPNNTKIIDNAAKFVLLADRDLAEKLLKKAKKLEPEDPKWANKLGHSYELRLIRERNKPKREEWGAKALEQYELAMELTGEPQDLDRLRTSAAKAAMKGGLLRKAKTYAVGLLKDQVSDNATHQANIILGRLALLSGEIEEAKAYLVAAGKVSSTPVLSTSGPSMLLAKELLEKEETEVVLQYFELCKKFWKKPKKLEKWTEEVEKGVIPDFGNNLIR